MEDSTFLQRLSDDEWTMTVVDILKKSEEALKPCLLSGVMCSASS